MQTHTDSNQTQNSWSSLFRPSRLFILAASIAALGGEARAEKNYLSWAQEYDPAANFSQNGIAVAMDRRGNVVATGYTYVGGREVYYTAKYDSTTGVRLWQMIGDRGFGNNRPSSIVCDSKGDVIVTGRAVGSGTGFDYYTIKYNGVTGEEKWKMPYNNISGSDEAIKVVVDNQDHVIVTGKSVGTSSQEDYYTIKYNKDTGNKMWDARYDSAGKFSDKPYDMAVDPDNNVVVTGSSRVGSNECYYTIKYNAADGTKAWDKVFDGPGNKDDGGRGVAIDGDGSVSITGVKINASGTYAFHTFRYFSDGTPHWNRKFDSPDDTYEAPAGIAVDGDGNVFVSGTSRLDNFKVTYYTVKYKVQDGTIAWEKRTEAPGDEDHVSAIKVDGNGDAVVTGYSKNEDFDYDFYTVKYDGFSGVRQWEQRIAGPNASGNDYAYGLAVDTAGNVAVTGTAKKAAPSPYNEMLTVKLNRFILTTGDPIQGPGLTPAAFISTFNVPTLSNNGVFGSKVTVKDGKKVYAAVLKQGGGKGNTAVALQGQPAPDVQGGMYKSFGDPVTSPGGSLAFSAKLSGVPGGEAGGVWTNAFTGNMQRALQIGKQAPGMETGVLVKGVTSISLQNSYLAALVTLKGAGVKGVNSTALVGMSGQNTGYKLLRTNDELTLDGVKSLVKKITVYTPPKTSPGHGRYHGDGRVVATATLADKRIAYVAINSTGTPFVLNGTNSAADNVAMGAKWKSFGPAAVGGNGFYFTALGTLQPKLGNVTAATDTVIAYSTAGGAFDDLAREGGLAPDGNGAIFTSLSDPVSNNFGNYAFLGTAKGGTDIFKSPKQGLWFGVPNGLDLVAYVGMTAPDAFGGWGQTATFTAIKNFALPGGADGAPLFLATVKGKGVSGKNNLGLWGVDSEGYLRQLFRNGDELGIYTVKKFTLLNSVAGCFSANRSFNATGGATALVNFTNKTSAIVYIAVP